MKDPFWTIIYLSTITQAPSQEIILFFFYYFMVLQNIL